MKKKIIRKVVFAIIWLGLLVSSLMLSGQIGGRGYTILIVAPKDGGTMETGVIAQYDTDIRITYASPQNAIITALEREHDVTIIGTNHHFARVMNYIGLSRSFFTQDAVEDALPVATLNRNAAMDIFGDAHRVSGHTFYFECRPFEMIGVIDDRDANGANIYVPITSIAGDGLVDSIAIDAGIVFFRPEVSELLHALQITDTSHHIFNLFDAYKLIEHYHFLTLALFILVIFEAITSNAAKVALRSCRKIARLNETEVDAWRIIFSKWFLALLIAIVIIALVFIIIGRESTDIFLSIREIIGMPNPFAAIPETVFTRHINELARWYFWTVVVFWTSLITFVLYFVINIWQSLVAKQGMPAHEQGFEMDV